MARARALAAVVVIVIVLAAIGCRPFASAGEPCADGPCAFGLVCVEGVCAEPAPVDAGPAPCLAHDECALQGSADGRACVDGECVWVECVLDAQCGTRVCDQGRCAPFVPCARDLDCAEGQLCEGSACRSPCAASDECLGAFQTCDDDGRCKQQCFIDLLCFGGLCVDGLCEPPECGADSDCTQEGNWFCNQGRCESFLPCDDDDDCFDANYRCNEVGRCEERPLCARDDECGTDALCIDSHCRPATTCAGSDAGPCVDGKECVAGRCVNAPDCRSNDDCASGEVCARNECRAEDRVAPARFAVDTPHGTCDDDGQGACALVLFAGETTDVRVGGFDDEGAPLLPELGTVGVGGGFDVALEALPVLRLRGQSAGGAAPLRLAEGGVVHEALTVSVVARGTATVMHVLVVDEVTGAPLEGATVTAGATTVTTGADGVAVIDPRPAGIVPLVSAKLGVRGVAVSEVDAANDLRLPLPFVDVGEGEGSAAGFRARAVSSGDEVGPVGVGIALPSLASVADVRLTALLGPPYVGTLEVPVLGQLPVALPAQATLEASLPLVGGAQGVRDTSYATTSPGRRSLTAFEGRYETNALFDLMGAGDDVELALDLAAGAEGMDVLVEHVGVLAALPLVADGDDVDGDGDVGELLPDYGAMPFVEVTPQQKPAERVGLAAQSLPADARARVLAVGGLVAPGYGFVPTGMSAFPVDGAARQLKVMPPDDDGLSVAQRAVVVEALFDDGSSSRLSHVGDAHDPETALGAFLTPPAGALVLDGVPSPGDRTLLLPAAEGATLYRVLVVGADALWHLYVPAGEGGGKSVALDATLGGLAAVLARVETARLDEGEAAHARFYAGAGPRPPLERAARAHATTTP